jgi:hypothetical protein
MTEAPESIWPDTLKIRDCKIYDDLGGSGKRIYTTAGNGYERKEYIRADISQAKITELEAALKECSAANRRAFCQYENFHKMLGAVDAVVDAALKETP